METGRRRSSSFHTDYEDGPPLPSLVEGVLVPDASPTDEQPAVADADEETFETLVRTRTRSRSVNDSEEVTSNQIVENATKPKEPKVDARVEPKELAGPIHTREVLALQKVYNIDCVFAEINSCCLIPRGWRRQREFKMKSSGRRNRLNSRQRPEREPNERLERPWRH